MEPRPSLSEPVGPESSCPESSKEPPHQIRIPAGLQHGTLQTNILLPGRLPQRNSSEGPTGSEFGWTPVETDSWEKFEEAPSRTSKGPQKEQ